MVEITNNKKQIQYKFIVQKKKRETNSIQFINYEELNFYPIIKPKVYELNKTKPNVGKGVATSFSKVLATLAR